jgi:hypothetical protein
LLQNISIARLEELFKSKGTKNSFFGKIFVLIGRFGVSMIFLGSWVGLSLQIPSGSLHTNFPLHFGGTYHTFFGKLFVLFGRYVLIYILGFWVEPANSVG